MTSTMPEEGPHHGAPALLCVFQGEGYLLQVWAEAMTIYRSGEYSMKFSKEIQKQLVEVQKDFMPEDTEAGQIQGFLEHYTGNVVCSKQLFKEAFGTRFLMSRSGGNCTTLENQNRI